MEDLTGKQFGTYRMISAFGEGGMATVYKAYQASMDRHVALKVLPRFHSSDREFLGRFEQEAKALAELQHPHILPVYDFGESEGYTYFVMPLMQDGNLAELLTDRRLSLARVHQIISQVGSALDFAHSRGFVHRDVKPSNILLDATGNCMLMDFGIAKIIEGSKEFTRTGGILGTPIYMSPEQGSGQKIDYKSDIYSLGIILYEMVTGRPPFDAETPVAVIFKHVHDPLPPPSSFNRDLSDEVEAVILKSLAKNPDDRFESVGELVNALTEAVTASLREEPTESELAPTVRDYDPAIAPVVPEMIKQKEIPAEPPAPVKRKEEVPEEQPVVQALSPQRLRPLIIALGLVGILALVLWLPSSGILPFDGVTPGDEIENTAEVATPRPEPTNTVAVVVAPTDRSTINTPQPPASTNTPLPLAYPPKATASALGEGLELTFYLGFNTDESPFDDLRIREALASAIDRTKIIDIAANRWPNESIVEATSFTPPDILGYTLTGQIGYPFDPDSARMLFAEAGYPDGSGFPITTLHYFGGEGNSAVALQVSESLREVLGINLSISQAAIDYPNLPALYVLGWTTDYVDPHSFLYDPFCGYYDFDFFGRAEYSSMVEAIQSASDFNSRSNAINSFSNELCKGGWDPRVDLDQNYKQVLDRALFEENYNARRNLYVDAEVILVEENIVVVPIYHRTR